jgi:hypothetical protein
MQLEIDPGFGMGPVRRGMSPSDVLEAFPESQCYEDWMGGNLNDSLLFHGLVFTFDKCNSVGPLPDSRLEYILVHQREDATLYGKPLGSWDKSSILERLRKKGHVVDVMDNGCLGVMGKLELCFANSGELDWVQIYVY